MTDSTRLEAIQAVVDRVTSYQDGAPEGTVESELRRVADEAGVELSDTEMRDLADAIETRHGRVHAAEVLAS